MLPLILALLQAPDSTRPDMTWTKGNVLWGAAATGAIAADCGITHHILHQPMPPGERAYERNIFLGSHPSDSRLVAHCAATALGAWGVAHLLPTKARKYWFGAVTLVFAGAFVRNLRNLRNLR